MVFISIIVILAALDLYIKKSVEEQDDSSFPRELKGSKGRIMLYKNHNPGFSFGCLKDRPELVQMVPLAAASFLGGGLAWMLRQKGNLLEKLAVAVTLGGAVSNLYERLTKKYVVDYFSFQMKGLKKVVFNLGDLFIFLGSAIILVKEFIRCLKEE